MEIGFIWRIVEKGALLTTELAIASTLGIGLVQIKGKKCIEVLSSPLYRPLTRLSLHLLENMAIGYCQFCGSYFEIGVAGPRGNVHANVAKENLRKALREDMGMRFWNWEVSQQKRLHIGKHKDGSTYERRFICGDCVSRVLSQFNSSPKGV